MKREYIVAYEEAYADGVYFSHPIGELGQELVRCKECKKANTKDCLHSYWDSDWGEWRGYKGDDWFCADGEREGE